MRWKHHPNLRLRPHAPAAGRGRLQTQIRRAFLIHGPVVSASTVYDWCYPRQRSSISCGQRWSVRRICRQLCDPICWPASRDPVAAAHWRGEHPVRMRCKACHTSSYHVSSARLCSDLPRRMAAIAAASTAFAPPATSRQSPSCACMILRNSGSNRSRCGGTHDGFPIARDVARICSTAQPLSGGVQFERSV
jgi:hypothetical protein